MDRVKKNLLKAAACLADADEHGLSPEAKAALLAKSERHFRAAQRTAERRPEAGERNGTTKGRTSPLRRRGLSPRTNRW